MPDPFSPFATTGLNPGRAPAQTALAGGAPAISGLAGPSSLSQSALWSHQHPLFWVAAIVGVTFGLIGANSAVRVGKFKAAVSAGK